MAFDEIKQLLDDAFKTRNKDKKEALIRKSIEKLKPYYYSNPYVKSMIISLHAYLDFDELKHKYNFTDNQKRSLLLDVKEKLKHLTTRRSK